MQGRYETSKEINNMIHEYLKRYRFIPSMKFQKYVMPKDIFVEWDELNNKIPDMIKNKLLEIKKSYDKNINSWNT
jgi:hypothetical protein